MNDGIDKDLCSLAYTSVDNVAREIVRRGQGALMAKIDIQQAYRNVPIYPWDRTLLGMKWKEVVYIDKVLPFGLRSAPIIFSALADALTWIIKQKGVEFLDHYLDDFISVGDPESPECGLNLSVMLDMCRDTGTPIEKEKMATSIEFLGVELDSRTMQIRLPADKLARLRQLTAEWMGRKSGKKRELFSLIDILSHACKAIRQGRSFLRRLIDLLASVKKLDHFVRLNLSAQSDIQWWYHFAMAWNGMSQLLEVKRDNPDALIVSDASGNWGC